MGEISGNYHTWNFRPFKQIKKDKIKSKLFRPNSQTFCFLLTLYHCLTTSAVKRTCCVQCVYVPREIMKRSLNYFPSQKTFVVDKYKYRFDIIDNPSLLTGDRERGERRDLSLKLEKCLSSSPSQARSALTSDFTVCFKIKIVFVIQPGQRSVSLFVVSRKFICLFF